VPCTREHSSSSKHSTATHRCSACRCSCCLMLPACMAQRALRRVVADCPHRYPDAPSRSAQGAEAWAHTLQRWQREERGQWQVCQARHGSLQAKRWQLRRGPGSQAGVLKLQCPTAGCCVAAEECTRHPPVHTLIAQHAWAGLTCLYACTAAGDA
jgi:hypothetical protein